MRFTIAAQHIKLAPSVGTYARRKLAATLGKLFQNPALSQAITVDLEFSLITRHHRKGRIWKADASLALPRRKMPLYASVLSEDIHSSIDLLAEEIEREIKKYKGRSAALMKRGARIAKKDLRLDPAARLYRRGRIRSEGD